MQGMNMDTASIVALLFHHAEFRSWIAGFFIPPAAFESFPLPESRDDLDFQARAFRWLQGFSSPMNVSHS
jgi:hypothetical protein